MTPNPNVSMYGWRGPVASNLTEARQLISSAMAGSGVGQGAAYQPVQAQLPWGSAGANPNDYAGSYRDALAMNQTNYDNLIKGFQSTLAAQQAEQQRVQSRYDSLTAGVLNDISGIGAARSQEINTGFTQAGANALQGMINRGLGNTSAASSLEIGIEADRQRAQNALAEQTAGLRAGYATQLGLASLGFAGNAIGANTALSQNQLAAMERVNASYPNALLHAQLAQQQGFAEQAGRDRAAVMGSAGSGYGSGGGLARNPSVGGADFLRTPTFGGGYNEVSFAPGGFGGFNSVGSVGYTPLPEVAGYGKGDAGLVSQSYGPAPREQFAPDPSASYPVAQADYGYDAGYDPSYYGGQGDVYGYGAAPQAEATGYMNDGWFGF